MTTTITEKGARQLLELPELLDKYSAEIKKLRDAHILIGQTFGEQSAEFANSKRLLKAFMDKRSEQVNAAAAALAEELMEASCRIVILRLGRGQKWS